MNSISIQSHYNKQHPNYNADYLTQPSQSSDQSIKQVPIKMGWFERNRKNKRQFYSIGPAALIFISGGMHIAFSFNIFHENHCKFWFIGAIIGTLIGSILCYFINRKLLFMLSSSFIIIGGILFVFYFYDDIEFIAALNLNGMASGLLFSPGLVLAGEESVKSLRGLLAASVEAMSFSLGIFLYYLLRNIWQSSETSFSLEKMLGTLYIIFGTIAIIVIFFFYVESPIFYLIRNDETRAIDSIRRLQGSFEINNEIYSQLAEYKEYISHNKQLLLRHSLMSNLTILLKLCLYRSLVALSYSFIIQNQFSSTAAAAAKSNKHWCFTIIGALRWLGASLSAFILDSFGRRKPILIGSVVCGGTSLIIPIIFHKYYLDPSTKVDIQILVYLLFAFQFFAGVIIGSSSAYLSEAFLLSFKPLFIGLAFITELVVHITCIIFIDIVDILMYFYATAAISFGLFFCGLLTLPETKNDNLLEAQIKFK